MLWEVAAVLLLVALAGAARFYNLAALPFGMHGDEAVAGLEAQRILREGSIGPYSPLALGQPSGPLYLTAVAVHFLGPTRLAVRVAPALAGTLCVAALYILLRLNLGRDTALVGAACLAVMNWPIHLSRVGFPIGTWPLFIIAAAACLCHAARRRQARWWAIAGATLAAGLYIYNAHHLFLGVGSLFALACWLGERAVPAPRRVAWALSFGAASLAVAAPMLLYIARPENDYFSHFREFSIFHKPEWQSLDGTGARLQFLAGRYGEFWVRLGWPGQSDGADGTGVAPIVPPLGLALAAVGIVLALRRRAGPLACLGALAVVLLPLGSVVTVDGTARRTFALAPFLAMFTAVALAAAWRWADRQRANKRSATHKYGVRAATVALWALLAWQNLGGYFGRFASSPKNGWIFAAELAAACDFMRELPAGSAVYLCSDRWPADYPTRQFLAPDVQASDRARFGNQGFHIDTGAQTPVFVLLGDYKAKLVDLQSAHPGGFMLLGTLKTGGALPNSRFAPAATDGDPAFIAYFVRAEDGHKYLARPLRTP